MIGVLSSISMTAVAKITEKRISYQAGNTTLVGYLYYEEDTKAIRPAIIVVHEWWGLNEYPKMRARKLAEMGYIAFCADMYGEGKVVDNPTEAQTAASEIFKNPELLKTRLNAAYQTLMNNPLVNKSKITAIGYCFGGSVVLNAANMGVPLQAVICFHGSFKGFKANKEILTSKVLICHGAADQFVTPEDVDNLKNEMNNIKATYEFKVYENATHAFTNKESTEVGRKFKMPIAYNSKADNDSWSNMIAFLKKYKLDK